MTETSSTCQPLVDSAVLIRLRDGLEPDSWVCDRFIQNYIELLPARLDNVHQAVESMDVEAALDAVLSLKTSSLMVGASRLGVLAGDLESKLRLSATGPCRGGAPLPSVCLSLLESIAGCTAGTVTRLAAHAAP